jgi:hypothetical protein
MNPMFVLICFLIIAALMMMGSGDAAGAAANFSPMTTISPMSVTPGAGITPGMFLPV